MRNFNANPTDLSDYTNSSLYDGEKVYHIAFGNISEAYAIREEGESMEDFMAEVDSSIRRKYGKNFDFTTEDVTGTFGPNKGCQVNDSSALQDLLDIYDYEELEEDAQDAIEELFDDLTVFDDSDCNRYWNADIDEDETNALIEKYADRIWTEDGTLRMAAADED